MELKRAAVGTYVKTTAGIVGKITILDDGLIVVACADQGLSSVIVKREDLTKSTKQEFDKVRNQPSEIVKLRQMAEENGGVTFSDADYRNAIIESGTAAKAWELHLGLIEARKEIEVQILEEIEAEVEEVQILEEIEAEVEEIEKGLTKRNGLLDPKATEKYVICVTSGGRKSKHKGDPVSVMLEGKSIDEVYQTVSEMTQTPEQTLRARWAHLNNGMQRMNAGNFLRRSLNTK